MWFAVPRQLLDWSPALRHLRNADPVLANIIRRVGPCTLAPRRAYFAALCQAIFTQQVSMTVADVLFRRFRKLCPNGRPTPQAVLALSDLQLRSAGASRQKQTYLRDLAARFASGNVPIRRFPRMSDEQIVQSLLPIKGIGRWTAEMFLIFVLNRPDVLPADDLGLRKNAQLAYRLTIAPTPADIVRIARCWRPWRTVATWFLWRFGTLAAPQPRPADPRPARHTSPSPHRLPEIK